MIKVYKQHKDETVKETLMYNYSLAGYIRNFIASILSNDFKPPTLYELYPELFKQELENKDKEKIEQELQLHKEIFREYAMRYNEKRATNQ